MSLQQAYDRWQAAKIWQRIEVIVLAAFAAGVFVGELLAWLF